MEPRFYEIVCPKCNKAGFHSNNSGKPYCKSCNYVLTDNDMNNIMDDAHTELMKGSKHIEVLRVFEFESGESEWVIATTKSEAKEYYASVLGGEIDEYEITELEDWHNVTVKNEVDELQPDGTYLKDQTMLEIAKEIYSKGYDEPTIIASTCV